MKNSNIFRHSAAGFIFVSVTGTLLHFLYEWTGENTFAAFIGAVNESTWEHMKILFIPMLLFYIYLLLKFHKKDTGIAPALIPGIVTGVILIPVLYYTYTGTLGYMIPVVNIIIFYISAAAGFSVFYYTAKYRNIKELHLILIFILILMAAMFILFTFYPPSYGLFSIPACSFH